MKKSLWALGEDGVIFKSWVIRLLLLVMAIVAIASYSMYRADHSANAGILVEAEKLPTFPIRQRTRSNQKRASPRTRF